MTSKKSFQTRSYGLTAGVVEAHSVHQRLAVGSPEHPRLWIAFLTVHGDTTDFDERQTDSRPSVQGLCILVHPSSEAKRVLVFRSKQRYR